MASIEKITPNLWFNTEAEEAAKFYTSLFKNSDIDHITYFTKAGKEIHKKEAGSVMTVEFHLEGQKFVALNGGPDFKFNEAISFIINCETQDEVDFFWDRLTEDGDPKDQQCGWLKDKFGLSWQVVPTILPKLMMDKNSERAERTMAAMLKMKKLNIRELEAASMG
jgi:predicted 3-demethylubiquinone-9 3-methyltransferase (glyoxalase superfamily)